VGMEQSYLSKLENDKSMPSNDIFRRLLGALDTSLPNFLSQFDEHYIRSTLCQIEDIENYYYKEQSKHKENSRKLLIGSSFLIVLATTLFYTGATATLFSETFYQYESSGVVLTGEPIDLFDGGLKRSNLEGDEFRKKQAEIGKRRDPDVIQASPNKGRKFILNVEGGRRHYYRTNESVIGRPQNSVLQILGVFLFTAGIMGFVFEFRMSRYRK
jgi:transcriptional regulator with XRE-family HTH domain